MPDEKFTIGQRMTAARRAMQHYLKKDAEVDGKYMAITRDLVAAHVRQPLIDAGINVVTRDIDKECDVLVTGRGTKIQCRRVLLEMAFVSEDDSEDREVYQAWGEATDMLDKALPKARSNAEKNIYLKAFVIETGESDESRVPVDADAEPELKYITHEHLAELQRELENRGRWEKFLDYTRGRTGRAITSPKELTEDDYLDGMENVEKMRKREAAKKENENGGNDDAGSANG